MSRQSRSAKYEQELAVSRVIREGQLEKSRIEIQRNALAQQAENDLVLRRLTSCWCGVDHRDNRRLTEPRFADKPVPRPLSPGTDRVFIGGLPFCMTDDGIRPILRDLLGNEATSNVDYFRILRDDDGGE